MSSRYTHAPAISFKQLSYLLAIADTLNFTRAAELCFVTQSTLSGGIAELERTLGVQLVERDRQYVALTPIGEETARRAQGILSAGNDLVARAEMAADPTTGYFKLGVIPTIAPFLLGNILMLKRSHFPALRLSVRESQTRVLLDEVENAELDAALVALPFELGKLRAFPLFDEKLHWVAHKADALLKGKKRFLNEIDGSKLLMLEKGHCLRDHALSACHRQAVVDIHTEAGMVEVSSLATMVQLVNSGLGTALLPAMAIQAGILNGTDVKNVALGTPNPERTIALVTRSSHPSLAFIEDQLCPLLKNSTLN